MNEKLLYEKLSYDLRGALIEVRKNFGSGYKETIYGNALAEELTTRGIKFEREKTVKIYSPKSGRVVGNYRPDFIIDDKIILEIKAVDFVPKNFIDQLYSYLRNSEYQLGFFVNFKSPNLYIKRIIYTNDRKPFLNSVSSV
jgi:GxxExxY protein